MDVWQWLLSQSPATTSPGSMTLLQSSGSGGTGIDPTTFWLILSALGTTVTTLASLLYKNERDRRIEAERKLAAFQEIAPDLAENVRWLVEEAQERDPGSPLPWPYRRPTAHSPAARPKARRPRP